MGLFDSIAGAVGSALGQGDDKAGEQGQGAQSILSNLLQQGGQGQSGGIVGQLLGSLGGDQGDTPSGGESGGQSGGLAGALESLAANGLGEQVSSWMSNNPNLPVSPEQIRDALGSDQVQQMAQASGLPIGDFLKHLAEHLPVAASEAAGAPPNG